ncbi:hypothetical protein F0L17_17610 [Streptomyces sp. TRM43335]|uniref:Uncharacterized protein n=1 Tax=Streptomyces taklimakanensis TaxID=2569853 RepID=A0A6G2BF82_9ACTN|nr:hypothetical protein [Streptomyces taklimakanensis]MTE20900.1 hypothetical protein [Streptomyces taklimakanensis]
MTTMITTEPVGRDGFASCLFDTGVFGADAFGAVSARPSLCSTLPIRERVSERPTQAPAVATVAQADTYALAGIAANGADNGQKQAQHHMWAFRGLEPWRDPA